jgi:lipocalin-like protein
MNALVGTWRLVRYYTAYEGEPEIYPLGRDALGYISYTSDGFMFGTMMRAGRAPFRIADRLQASPEEKARAFDDYVTYCGRYRVEGDLVHHAIELSLLPNWIGEEQPRRIESRAGGCIALVGEWVVGGRRRVAVVEWERAK